MWRKAKNNAYLRENKLRFGEDLTKEDKMSLGLKYMWMEKKSAMQLSSKELNQRKDAFTRYYFS